MPKLSVLLPVHNGIEKYPDGRLLESIESILNLSNNLELIIIDDGSTDHTYEYLRSITDARIIILKQSTKQGQAVALNKGLEIATGKYIWQWSVRATATKGAVKLIDMLDNNPSIGFAYGKMVSYGGAKSYVHTPPKVFEAKRFVRRYLANFYMFRRIKKIEYVDYLTTNEGNIIGIADRDMLMQLMDNGLVGRSIPDTVCVMYYNGGEHTYTQMQKHRKEIDAIFRPRWEHIL